MKRVCVACNARFYDMTKTPPVCPKCGTEQPLDQPRIRRAAGNVAEDKRLKKPAVAPGVEAVEGEGVEDTEEEDVLEAADDRDDDTDAIAAALEVETDSDDVER